VVATSSILQMLTSTELEAVIGHEIGHVIHRDVLTSSVAATIAGVISYIGNIALYSMMFGGMGGSGNNRQGGNPIVFVAAITLVPLGATFVRLGISRGLEYNADEYGAKLTQNPGALASALQKISAKAQTRGMPAGGGNSTGPSPATASLWIVNPFRGSAMLELFSTHPSTQHRVERLRKIALQMGVYVQ
jgi:heat shock protein HtpX